MPVTDVGSWMDEYSREGTVWFAKRLSANDTLATNAHQAGPYLPKDFVFDIIPSLNTPAVKNPDFHIDTYIDSHCDNLSVRIIWYNNKLHRNPETGLHGTRNEVRMTNWGGMASPVLDPSSTGALAVFVFVLSEHGIAESCHVWVCDDDVQADLVEERIGVVEPKFSVMWKPGILDGLLTTTGTGVTTCRLALADIPPAWLAKFPTGEEIVAMTRARRPDLLLPVDDRLTRRRDCEYEIFRSVEEAVYSSRISEGFSSLENFISLAQTILQSRKSRSGTSLELHARDIFTEDGLIAGVNFTHRPTVEGGKKPDFVFPSVAAYNDPTFPQERLRILAAKTTCKDRWRQVINEANRVPVKHLLTLQEGVSVPQFMEMRDAGVKLVVPSNLHKKYPEPIRAELITFESFIAEVRTLNV